MSIDKPKPKRKKTTPHLDRQEYRTINLGLLADYIEAIADHAARCKQSIKLLGVIKDMGLASSMDSRCTHCGKVIRLKTSTILELTRSQRHYDINVRAVWGGAASGSGAFKTGELLATMGMPGLTSGSFYHIEKVLAEWWEQLMGEEIVAAGKEEKRLAELRGDYHEGWPACTVVGDGGWSKRSHKHSYNAPGGVAILVGAVTGRLLYVGVRNKTCSICTVAKGQGKDPPPHICYRNWDQSSTAMETDVILAGFHASEKMHGLRYMRYVGDGDASVMAALLERGPDYCQRGLKKLECANHVTKGIRGKLEKLVTDNPHFQGPERLPKTTRVRLTTAIRCAIRMRSSDEERVASGGY